MENSGIEWTDHTFNPWWGCMKVSDGCKNCYAETLDHRWNGGHWGPNSDRKVMSEAYWKGPLKWNRDAALLGVKKRVFCASMADVFEDHKQVRESRLRLMGLIAQTPNLNWQLLTKRPENIMRLLWDCFAIAPADHPALLMLHAWVDGTPPPNVWMGTTVENQKAEDRIPHLLAAPAVIHFLSCEPLIGHVDLSKYIEQLDWIICGGESGHGARPMDETWAMNLRAYCHMEGVAFFMKQGSQNNWPDYKNIESFPAPLQLRELPNIIV